MTGLRLDLLSPLPPVRSGISDYSVELLAQLAPLCDVRVVRLPGQPIAPELEAHWTPVAYEHLGEGGRLPLYQMGNNHYHEGVRRAALRLPGVLVLHDLLLHHSLLDVTIGRGEWEPYATELEADHGWIGAAVARGVYWGAHCHAAQFSLHAHRGLLRRQRGVLVHSAWAAEALREEDPDLRVRVVPMGIPLPAAADAAAGREFRRRHGLPLDRPLLGSFGFQTPIKRSAAVVEALTDPALHDAHLLVVGEESLNLDLGATARALGVADRVHVLGYVPFEQFAAAIAAVDLCLNLRYPTAGETSASLLRVLAAGRPAVVSDFAQFTELPDTVAVRVPLGEGEHETLARELGSLLGSPERLRAMGEAAREYVRVNHDPARAAAALLEACLDFADQEPLADSPPRPGPPTSLAWHELPGNLEVEGAEAPWPPGERRRLRLRLSNDGPAVWLAAEQQVGGIGVALHLFDAEGRDLLADRPWVAMPQDLRPGEQWSFAVDVRRPLGSARLEVEPRVLGRVPMRLLGGPAWEAKL